MTTTVKKKRGKSSSDSMIGFWLIGAGFALVAVVIGYAFFTTWQRQSTPVAQPDVPAEWIDRTSLGSPEAPVVVQLWEDFLCPSCQAFSRGVKPQLVEEYVKSGQVRLEFHHFPLQQHAPGSFMTALGAECAADQNLFWPFHDKAFQVISNEQQGGATFEKLSEFATVAGLDVEQFQGCLSGQQHQETITTSLTQAGELGLSFTPSVIVDGALLQDSSLANVKASIDAALAANVQ